MTQTRTRLLINRFDRDPEVNEYELDDATSVSGLKELYFTDDLKEGHNIRLIHRGLILKEEELLRGVKGHNAGDALVITVFVTKPDTTQHSRRPEARSELWKWSTSAWIMVVATLWCYRFKLTGSFRNFPVIVLYLATFLCLQMIFTRVIGTGRMESR